MAKEYIEREKAIEWFMAFVHMGESDIPAETVITDLKYAIPAADVAPVRYGRWEKRGSKWQCTNCKVLMSIDGTPQENLLYYCPNCGVLMDKEEPNEL